MDIEFYKLQCFSNDFILINCIGKNRISPPLFPVISKHICRRSRGVGASGAIFLSRSGSSSVRIDVFSSAGIPRYTCNDGILCATRYLFDSGMVDPTSFSLTVSDDHELTVDIIDSNNFRIPLGHPKDVRKGEQLHVLGSEDYTVAININEKKYYFFPIHIQKNFFVYLSPKWDPSLFRELSQEFFSEAEESHDFDLVFMFLLSREEGRIKVFPKIREEADFTAAAAAASIASTVSGLSDNDLVLSCNSETVFSQWIEETNTSFITGSADYVFSGSYYFSEISGLSSR